MNRYLLSFGILSLLINSSFADFIGAGVGIGGFNHKESGWIQKEGNEIDLQNDLHFDSKTDGYVWAFVEHPVPLIPNIKIVASKLKNSGEGKVSKNIKYGDLLINVNGYERSSFELNQIDSILYYEILDNWVNLDVGINIKYIDGSAEISALDPSTFKVVKNEKKDFKFAVPMVYADARVDIPMTNFSIGLSANAITYDSSTFYDTKIYINHDLSVGFGAELGYRQEKLKIDDIDDIYSDIKIKGAYAGVYFRF